MTFLTAAQSAAIRLIGQKPSTFVSSQNTFEMEIVDLAKDVVRDIVKYCEWRSLIVKHQMVGNGVTMAFDKPDDYDRMPKSGRVTRANWYTWGYVDAPSLNFWNDLINGLMSPSPGYWIILDGKFQFSPPIGASTTAEFYYISKNAVIDGDDQSRKAEFTKDEDDFVLDESLLTLGLIWKWRAQKRLEYAEDLQNYEIRMAQVSSDDRGARILQGSHKRWGGDVHTAYPKPLGAL
jgi:hypothetical protein